MSLIIRISTFATSLLFSSWAMASSCSEEDFQRQVSGESQCLVMRSYGDASSGNLLVWVHGDLSKGGPANYHFPIAEMAARAVGEPVLSVALVRPGYPDGEGKESTVAGNQKGRGDLALQVVSEVRQPPSVAIFKRGQALQ